MVRGAGGDQPKGACEFFKIFSGDSLPAIGLLRAICRLTKNLSYTHNRL